MKKLNLVLAAIIGFLDGIFFYFILKTAEVEIPYTWSLPFALALLCIAGMYVASAIAAKIRIILQVARFFLVGTLNTFIDLGVLYGLDWIIPLPLSTVLISLPFVYLFKIPIIRPFTIFAVCKGISFITATTNSYFWNKYWTFAKKEKPIPKEFLKFLYLNMTTKIKVVGIGGSGGNAISRMKKSKIAGPELIAINTDYQDLKKIKADLKLRIGREITQGLGTGMNPEIGRKAAEEQRDEIAAILRGADMIFLTGGLGGGSFTGAAPVVAEISRNLGILTIAICTIPFSFEGNYRRKIALAGKEKLRERVDALIIIKNDKLLENLDSKIPLLNAFWLCDDILREGVRGISDLIMRPGIVNIDFASIKTILKDSGTCLFGMGRAAGEKRAEKAAKTALDSPLLDILPKGAKGVLFNVSGGKDISLSEIEEIGRILTQEINPQAKVLFGAVEDEKLRKGELKVTVIVTGF